MFTMFIMALALPRGNAAVSPHFAAMVKTGLSLIAHQFGTPILASAFDTTGAA